MIGAVLSYLDGLLATALSDPFRIAAWATCCGVASMYLYAIFSPQRRLAELRSETMELQKKLAAYQGDFAGAARLMRQNLSVSFRRLGFAFVPSLIAGLPVIVVLIWMADGEWSGIAFGPPWLQSWLTLFLVVTTCSALAAKRILRIS